MDVVQNTYRQRPQGGSYSRSLVKAMLLAMIDVCLFISVLYMTGDKKSTILVKLDRFILLRGKPIKTLGSV